MKYFSTLEEKFRILKRSFHLEVVSLSIWPIVLFSSVVIFVMFHSVFSGHFSVAEIAKSRDKAPWWCTYRSE